MRRLLCWLDIHRYVEEVLAYHTFYRCRDCGALR